MIASLNPVSRSNARGRAVIRDQQRSEGQRLKLSMRMVSAPQIVCDSTYLNRITSKSQQLLSEQNSNTSQKLALISYYNMLTNYWNNKDERSHLDLRH